MDGQSSNEVGDTKTQENKADSSDGADIEEAPRFPDPPFEPPDEKFRVSTADGKLFAPLGISTAGYGQSPGDDAPRSPFAKGFQATTEIVHPPGVRVIHMLKGTQRILWVQTDLIGVYYLFYERIADIVLERTGVDVRESMVLMANHTHTGPGRIVNFVIGGLFADAYNEVIFEKMMQSIAEPIISVITAEARPARFGFGFSEDLRIHKDRRCENPEYANDTLAVLRFDEVGTGETLAVVVNYAMHGTIFGVSDGKLSGDAPRSVELKVQEVLPGAPLVMYVQSWAGDMAPRAVEVAGIIPEYAADFEPKLDELEAIGRSAANAVLAIWEQIEMKEDVEIQIMIEQAPLRYDLLGYTEEIFPYEFGAAFCGGTNEFCPEDGKEPNMGFCFGIPEEFSLQQIRLSAARIGSLVMMTLPGEPVTTLGEYLLDKVRAADAGVSPVLFGYAQDYSGYLLLPEDWYGGGYESASNFWGPFQGQFLADNAASLAGHLLNPDRALAFEPVPALPYVPGEGDEYQPGVSLKMGEVRSDFPAQAELGARLIFSWAGGDPWLDSPSVALERLDDDGSFLPFRAGGRLVDESDYRISLTMTPEPAWGAEQNGGENPISRLFQWTATLRTAVKVPAPSQVLTGTFRVRVTGRAREGDGMDRTYEVISAAVTLGEVKK